MVSLSGMFPRTELSSSFLGSLLDVLFVIRELTRLPCWLMCHIVTVTTAVMLRNPILLILLLPFLAAVSKISWSLQTVSVFNFNMHDLALGSTMM